MKPKMATVNNPIINYRERQGMCIKNKAGEMKVIWTENVIIICTRQVWGVIATNDLSQL